MADASILTIQLSSNDAGVANALLTMLLPN